MSYSCMNLLKNECWTVFQIKLFVALGPVATVGHIKAPIRFLSYLTPEIKVSSYIIHVHAFVIKYSWYREAKYNCKLNNHALYTPNSRVFQNSVNFKWKNNPFRKKSLL